MYVPQGQYPIRTKVEKEQRVVTCLVVVVLLLLPVLLPSYWFQGNGRGQAHSSSRNRMGQVYLLEVQLPRFEKY